MATNQHVSVTGTITPISLTTPLALNSIAGFADVQDSALAAEQPARAIHIARIASNAQFGMVRTEFFQDKYKNGDTVILPISPIDGYNYSRDELLYHWTINNTHNPQTNWLTGPDCLWFLSHKVDQVTGLVSCEEWYRKSSVHNPDGAKSNDGVLLVTTVAQRQLQDIVLSAVPTFQGSASSAIAIDKPVTDTGLLKKLNQGAKFSAINTEFIYLGEFADGDQVPQPVSPADGHIYAYTDCSFIPSWRWTTFGDLYKQPDNYLGQLQRMQMSVSTTGVVSTRIDYKGEGSSVYQTAHGRLAVFAHCSRALGSLTGGPFDDFTELDNSFFLPGQPLRASTMTTIDRNILEATMTPEVFAAATKTNGQTVSLPTGGDGYAFARDECVYFSWIANTGPETDIRLPIFGAHVDRTTGVVTLDVWRLPAGHPPFQTNDGSVRVVAVGARKRHHPELVAPVNQPPDDPTPADLIHGSIQYTLQTAAKSGTTLFTPPVGRQGFYKVTYNAKVTRAATTSSTLGGANGFQLHYTADDDGQAAVSPTTTGDTRNTLAAAVTGSVYVNVRDNTAVTFDFGYTSSGATTMQYTLTVAWDEVAPTGGPIIGGVQYNWLKAPGPSGNY